MSDDDKAVQISTIYDGMLAADKITAIDSACISIANAQATDLQFPTANGRAMVIIHPTESGFDVTIPEGVTMTEAAAEFIRCVKLLIGQETAE